MMINGKRSATNKNSYDYLMLDHIIQILKTIIRSFVNTLSNYDKLLEAGGLFKKSYVNLKIILTL
jgi:hypothetical protein